jgi:hypothetical protein
MTSPSISLIRLPPPRLEDVPEEGKGKAKECHEVGEGEDTVTIEDTSDDEDGETLQERFQLRSRFSRPGLPNTPSSSKGRLVWRLAFPRRQGGRAMWRGNAPPKN